MKMCVGNSRDRINYIFRVGDEGCRDGWSDSDITTNDGEVTWCKDGGRSSGVDVKARGFIELPTHLL